MIAALRGELSWGLSAVSAENTVDVPLGLLTALFNVELRRAVRQFLPDIRGKMEFDRRLFLSFRVRQGT